MIKHELIPLLQNVEGHTEKLLGRFAEKRSNKINRIVRCRRKYLGASFQLGNSRATLFWVIREEYKKFIEKSAARSENALLS